MAAPSILQDGWTSVFPFGRVLTMVIDRENGMKLTWFGHSAFRIDVGHPIILIDPFLSGNPRFAGDPVAASAGATHVVLTDGHDDHVGDAAEILTQTKAQLIGNYEICMFLNA
jgi:L-ascorbate metabolism protein UlaG (beta-lactamase superfamily)